MRRARIALLVGLLVGPAALAQSAEEQLQDLGYLAGSWAGPMGDAVFEAWYSTPEGGKVLSSSQLLAGGQLLFYEFEKFEVAEDKVVLTPFPGGQQAAQFELVEVDAKGCSATFDSPKNDFPSRIVYAKDERGHLVITLSDPHGGSDQQEVFDLAPVEKTASEK